MPPPAVFLSNPDGTVTGSAGKSAGDKLRVGIDLGNEPMIIGGARAVSQSVTAGGTGAPTVSGTQLDFYYQLSAVLTGGQAGVHNIVFSVTLDDADATVISRTGQLKIN